MAQSRKMERATGRCPEHGIVEGVRYLPKPMFPFIVYYLRLRAARKAPFLCPECDRAISLSLGESDSAGMQKAG
jgi:hypothetical protein